MPLQVPGVIRMKGDDETLSVEVVADPGHLLLLSHDDLIGDWDVVDLGIISLNDGFSIRAEGEEMLLKTDDDVALAEELGLVTASPRMARRRAASHPPEEREPALAPEPVNTRLAPIVLGLSAALVLVGGLVMSVDPLMADAGFSDGGIRYWVALLVGGALIACAAIAAAVGANWARYAAMAVLAALVVVFVMAAVDASGNTAILAFGFVAGGIVAATAAVFSGGLDQSLS